MTRYDRPVPRRATGDPPRVQPRAGTMAGTMVGVPVRRWRPPWPIDVRLALAPHRRGRGDPAHRVTPDGAVWRASRTPAGPGTLRLVVRDRQVEAEAWGPGAQWLLETVPALLGEHDDPRGFRPLHPVLRDAARRLPGLRIGRTSRVFEALVPAVLEQKVTGAEAWRAWRLLLRRFGEPAPGPLAGLVIPPAASAWADIPSWEWHRAGAEPVRARTVRAAAAVAARLEETLDMAADEADRRLRTVPGIGVWTAAEVRQRAHGDADAVSVGDYHIPAIVGWALLGRRVDDAGMLDLLAPYAGHRHRVTRMLELAGAGPPRRGPRMPVRDYRSI